MAATADNVCLDVKRIFWTNLSLLDINPKNFKAKYDIDFYKDSFDIPNPTLACKLLYELGMLLNEKLAHKYLKIELKSMNKQIECDFKKCFFQFLKAECIEKPELNLQEICSNQLVNLHGKNFYYFLAMLTGSILYSFMLVSDPSIAIPNFVFDDGLSHKMFVESYAESCQKFCLVKSKKIIDLIKKQINMKKTFNLIKKELVEEREKLKQQIYDMNIKCNELCKNDQLNDMKLSEFSEVAIDELHSKTKELLENLHNQLEIFIDNQPHIDNARYDGLNTSILQNNLSNYSMQVNDFNKTINLNTSYNTFINNNEKSCPIDIQLLLERVELALEQIQLELDEFTKNCNSENFNYSLSKWNEFKERHSKFLFILESLLTTGGDTIDYPLI